MKTHPVIRQTDMEAALQHLRNAFQEQYGKSVAEKSFAPATWVINAVLYAMSHARAGTSSTADGGTHIPTEKVPEHIALVAEGRDLGYISAEMIHKEFPRVTAVYADAAIVALDEIVAAYYGSVNAQSAPTSTQEGVTMSQDQQTASPVLPAESRKTGTAVGVPLYPAIPFDPSLAPFIASSTNALVAFCHGAAAHSGWWVNPKTGADPRDNPMCFSNKLCLIHSEISEAMEGDRKGLKDDKLPHRDMREVELADALIRICDLAGAYNMDLGGAVAEKLAYNAQRADHKPENRVQDGGKAY